MLLNVYVPMMYYRNGLLFGLPMFLMGMFIREHREELSRRFAPAKLWLLIGLGAVLSLIQWFVLGNIDLPLGMLITAFSLMLLMAEKPQVYLPDKLTALLGDVSLAVYIIHYLLYLVLLAYAGGWDFLAGLRDSSALPVIIAAVSVVLGFIYAVLKQKIQERLL